MTHRILITAASERAFEKLQQAFSDRPNVTVERIVGGQAALDRVAAHPPDLVVADENLGDMTGLDLINELVKIAPLTNTAAVSSLSEEDFHETFEGLGVLAHLPPEPGESEAALLLGKLDQLSQLMAGLKK